MTREQQFRESIRHLTPQRQTELMAARPKARKRKR